MGNLREGETDRFPVESRGEINYILIKGDGGWKHFKSTKTDKTNLLIDLKKIESKKATLLGIWQGKWRSDVFVLDIPEFIEMLENSKL